jgi:outer membrane protein TolC
LPSASRRISSANAPTCGSPATRYSPPPPPPRPPTPTASPRSRIFNPETTTASIIAGLSAPIFDAGRLRANLEASTAQLDQTIEGYRSSVLLALSETENALIACRRTAERLTTLEEATRLAREADDLAQKRYQAGVIDFTDVLDTQRSLLALEDSLLNTSTDRTTAYIRLYQALGGGWSS